MWQSIREILSWRTRSLTGDRTALEDLWKFPDCLRTWILPTLFHDTTLTNYDVSGILRIVKFERPCFEWHLSLLRFCCCFVLGNGSGSGGRCPHSKIRTSICWSLPTCHASCISSVNSLNLILKKLSSPFINEGTESQTLTDHTNKRCKNIPWMSVSRVLW